MYDIRAAFLQERGKSSGTANVIKPDGIIFVWFGRLVDVFGHNGQRPACVASIGASEGKNLREYFWREAIHDRHAAKGAQ
jgi:hypothetical protein